MTTRNRGFFARLLPAPAHVVGSQSDEDDGGTEILMQYYDAAGNPVPMIMESATFEDVGETPRERVLRERLEAMEKAQAEQHAATQRREVRALLATATEYVDRTLLARSSERIMPAARADAIMAYAQALCVDASLPVRFFSGELTDAGMRIDAHPTGVAYALDGGPTTLAASIRAMFAANERAEAAISSITQETVAGNPAITPVAADPRPETAAKAAEEDEKNLNATPLGRKAAELRRAREAAQQGRK